MQPEQGNAALGKFLRGTFVYFVIPLVFTGGPIAWFSGPKWWSGLTTSLSRVSLPIGGTTAASFTPVDPSSAGPDVATESSAGAAPLPVPASEPSLSPSAPPLHELTEVLRFDITPRWIADRWPRVSAGLGQLQLQGYRVPLVTGTAEDDLAGALTYYFNPWQQVQRITFIGTTGDVRKVVTVLTGSFGFTRRLTNDPSLFVYEAVGSDERVRSVLWIRHVPVLKASQPRERFEVALTLERPLEK